MQPELVANYLSALKTKTGLSYPAIAEKSKRSESTIKNLCLGKADDPRIDTVAPVVYALGGSMDEMLNPEKSRDEVKESSILALKDSYEYQFSLINETREAHVANIRSHYERELEEQKESFEKLEAYHTKELCQAKEYYESRLADKISENKWLRIFCLIQFVIFTGLCLVELYNLWVG